MARVLSGIQATGNSSIGNYLGALKIWAEDQHKHESLFFIADLHSLTVNLADESLAANTRHIINALLASGIDPDIATLFIQSHVPENPQFAWLMECTVSFGELRRMTQFKDKSEHRDFISVGLFTYPALQAADILLYNVNYVPVGEDQRQHVELARDAAIRFNQRIGQDLLVVPEASIPRVGAKIRDLQDPTKKMSKSSSTEMGIVYLTDDDKTIEKKIKRSVTDTDGVVAFDPDNKPGISNLLTILGASTGRDPSTLADEYSQYGPLKSDVAEALISMITPIRNKMLELDKNPDYVDDILAKGAAVAHETASATLKKAKEAVGLLAPKRKP